MHTGSIFKQATASARRSALVALVGAVVIVGGFLAERAYFQDRILATTERLVQAHTAADLILLADERLTMSANMATATGEARWIDRYEANIPLINGAIAEAVALAPPAVAKRFDSETRFANDRLVELERKSFDAVRKGDTGTARAILDGPDYARYKRTLSAGTARFVDGMIASVTAERTAVQQRAMIAISLVVLISVAGAAILWRVLTTTLSKSETVLFEAQRKIQTLAMNDLLTGLANRASLREALHAAIGRSDRNRSKLAVLMIDLDRFKPINDRYGHLVGDLVLKAVAHRMSRVLRRGEIRARYGGDEFVAVIEYPSDDEIPRVVGKRLIEELSEPMAFEGITVQIGASVGLAVYPTDARTEEDLIRKADIALYRVKQEGRGSVRFYNSSMVAEIDARAKLEEELREAIELGPDRALLPAAHRSCHGRAARLRGAESLGASNPGHRAAGRLHPARRVVRADRCADDDDSEIGMQSRAPAG